MSRFIPLIERTRNGWARAALALAAIGLMFAWMAFVDWLWP